MRGADKEGAANEGRMLITFQRLRSAAAESEPNEASPRAPRPPRAASASEGGSSQSPYPCCRPVTEIQKGQYFAESRLSDERRWELVLDVLFIALLVQGQLQPSTTIRCTRHHEAKQRSSNNNKNPQTAAEEKPSTTTFFSHGEAPLGPHYSCTRHFDYKKIAERKAPSTTRLLSLLVRASYSSFTSHTL